MRWSYELAEERSKATKDINGNVEETNMIGNLDERTIRRHQANLASGATTLMHDPETYVEALSSDQSKEWKVAIRNELEALERNGTFSSPQDLPCERTTVKTKWVFKTKRDTLGRMV